MRFTQYLKPLQHHLPGTDFTVQPLLDGNYLRRKYAGQGTFAATLQCYARRALSAALHTAPQMWWIEKELWPYAPALVERGLLRRAPYVLDLDDAIFHNYDLHRLSVVRRLYGRKIDRLMAGAALVTAGNDYLAQRARNAGARWVEVLPTVVDLDRYPAVAAKAKAKAKAKAEAEAEADEDVLRIGWIGSPSTVAYLQQIAEPLRWLSRKHRVRLTVVGGGSIDLPGVEVEVRPWSEASEVAEIRRFDIGVMPLTDSPWERGKCGYKLIQYMACSVPVVASAVGANQRIVTDDVNGFLAADDAGWLRALDRLATDRALRARLGAAGRARVVSDYCVQVTAPRVAGWMQTVVPGVR